MSHLLLASQQCRHVTEHVSSRTVAQLSTLHKLSSCLFWHCPAALSAELLQAALPKPPRIRLGNWERRPLDPDQQAYAACDAYASLALHWALAALQARVTVSQVAVAADSKEDVVEQ